MRHESQHRGNRPRTIPFGTIPELTPLIAHGWIDILEAKEIVTNLEDSSIDNKRLPLDICSTGRMSLLAASSRLSDRMGLDPLGRASAHNAARRQKSSVLQD